MKPDTTHTTKAHEKIHGATVRFTGDSGDGMQLVGAQFTQVTGLAGNDVMTFPDFPAEIRAPQGTTAGVSGFQVHFGDHHIYTPGDKVDVLVAMNPAALKANLKDLRERGVLLVNSDEFDEKNLTKVDYQTNPLEGDELKHKYRLIAAPITESTRRALAESGLSTKEIDRCKNFFALGLTYWMFSRDIEKTKKWLEAQFAKKPHLAKANIQVLEAGYHYAETTELFDVSYEITKAEFSPGTYRNITGNSALALGLVAAADLAGLPALYAGYPITPASDILHELSKYKNYNVKTFQTEDEIAAACAAIGASYGGSLGITASSGPGVALKSEAINLAVMTELPVVVIDVQRAGPSTGMPTKNEQTDLLMALYGRNGESPVPVVAAQSPADCFDAAIEATRLALKFMTPVFLLSDAYIANSSEPWKIPEVENLPEIDTNKIQAGESREGYKVYGRAADTLARRWPVPGTPGFEHRIGGIEKDENGNINYDPENHDKMVNLRQAKINKIADFIPELEAYPENKGGLLVLGWGSTYGAIREAVLRVRKLGYSVSHAHLRHLNPFPKNIEKVLRSFEKVLIPELNLGQLGLIIRGKYLIPAVQYNKVRGRPFGIEEMEQVIINTIKG
ncbi:MAG: 2-oxoacid:acceptor oxidoreductase subunit alpha [Leptospiraceae bacterium]|nr:2-oxoacid:acceptor oxidoreductase subunit alpha [Leptospiraceae bacterium]